MWGEFLGINVKWASQPPPPFVRLGLNSILFSEKKYYCQLMENKLEKDHGYKHRKMY